MTFAREERDVDDGRRLLGRSLAPSLLLCSPPLNAANDNESTPHLVPDSGDCVSVASVESQVRTSFGTAVLITISVATISIIAMGWIYIVSATLLDTLRWALG